VAKPRKHESPRQEGSRATGEGLVEDTRAPGRYAADAHDIAMFGMASRIRWLDDGHTHWWIRSIREHQRECERCYPCDGQAA
jgi:hypothetical protein